MIPCFRARIGFLALFLLIPLQTSFAQTTPPAATVSADTHFTVTGTVLDSQSGDPIRGALVRMSQFMGLTDAKGRFEFDNVPAITSTIMVEKPGYLNPQQQVGSLQRPNMITVGPDLAPTTLKLIPEAIIYGQVNSAEGEPLEGIPVRALESVVTSGVRTWQQGGGMQTDDEGRFRMASLAPGAYYLCAGPSRTVDPSPADSSARRPQGYSLAYFPSGHDLDSATPIIVKAGERVQADFSLSTQPFYQISGTVSGYQPGPTMNISLQLRPVDGGPGPGIGVNSQTGVFQSPFLAAGQYILQAIGRIPPQAQAGRTVGTVTTLSARLNLTVNSDLTNLHLGLGPEPVIPVHCDVDWAANPNSGNVQPVFLDFFRDDQDTPGITLNSIPRMGLEGPPGQQKMIVSGLEPGSYWVNIHPNGPLYVASATFENQDLLRGDLIIGENTGSHPIEISLRDDGATIVAKLSEPAALAFTVPEESPRTVHVSVTVPMMGSVAPSDNLSALFGNLAPGTYRVFALDDADGLEYEKPGALDPYLSDATVIVVGPKQQGQVTLQVMHREK